jgi:membrane associated rhomboid family serine protease
MSDLTVPARGARLVSKLLSRDVDEEECPAATAPAATVLAATAPAASASGVAEGEPAESYADGLAMHASRAVFGIALVTLMLAVMWALEVIDYVTADDTSDVSDLERWGIRARHISDLPHIFTAPFLHAGLPHLMANSVPFLVLGVLASIRGVGKFVIMNIVVIVTSGLGIWFFGPTDAVTLGASILIFGYFGYLVGRGVFERHIVDAAMAIVVVVFYGTMVGGTLPSNPNISWQGHLFGLVGGLIASFALRSRRPPRDTPQTEGAT